MPPCRIVDYTCSLHITLSLFFVTNESPYRCTFQITWWAPTAKPCVDHGPHCQWPEPGKSREIFSDTLSRPRAWHVCCLPCLLFGAASWIRVSSSCCGRLLHCIGAARRLKAPLPLSLRVPFWFGRPAS
jgi:hypothetical protein